ncbi:hypothetical protein BHM03_00009058 [Ensete ventricosum]|nr:hypothetical protein BHM03_00009058 [Ensete ventricosum]
MVSWRTSTYCQVRGLTAREEKKEVKDRTSDSGALEEDLLGGDRGEAGAGVLVFGVAKLGPGPALDGEIAESGAGGGSDAHLAALVVEPVLDHYLHYVLVGP